MARLLPFMSVILLASVGATERLFKNAGMEFECLIESSHNNRTPHEARRFQILIKIPIVSIGVESCKSAALQLMPLLASWKDIKLS